MGRFFWGSKGASREGNKAREVGEDEGRDRGGSGSGGDSKQGSSAVKDLFKKGLNKMADENLEEAIQYFDLALRLDQNFTDAWIKRGYCFFHLNNYSQAIISYDRALAIEPNNTEAWNLKALAFYRMKNYEKAIECANRVIDIDPDDGMGWYNKACYLSLAGRVEEAIDALKRAIEIDIAYAKKAVKDRDLENIKHDIVFKRVIEVVVLEAIRMGHGNVGKIIWVTGMNRQEIEEALNSLILKGLIVKKTGIQLGLTMGKEEQYELAPELVSRIGLEKPAITHVPVAGGGEGRSREAMERVQRFKELSEQIERARSSVEKGDVDGAVEHIGRLLEPRFFGSILIEHMPDLHRDLRLYHMRLRDAGSGKNYLNANKTEILGIIAEIDARVDEKVRKSLA
ncbi:MAG: tetratricopeptide repeat protein [Candidatus Nitrosocaldus sp.]|nr:tetratricopeptide repeat protein [Candidatus Nitrosocaldus sp.]MDW7999560.1 tetratricopeptide repeat protein [Candidatus Nitrosocaldus sp.]